MKKIGYIAIGLVVIAIPFVSIWLIAYIDSYYSRPYATFVAVSGEVGDLRIGETKEEILHRLKNQAFAVDPKPPECPVNWIDVATMSNVYRACLLKTDNWEEGSASTIDLCKEHSDVFTKLAFREGRLVTVTTECWHPE